MAVTRTPRKTNKPAGKPAARKAPAAAPEGGMTLVPSDAPGDAPGDGPVDVPAGSVAPLMAIASSRRPAPKHAAVSVPRSSMEDWPPQAELVLSAIEAGQYSKNRVGANGVDRRQGHRTSFRVRAQLRLYSDNPGEPGRVVYTRDIHARGLGFITPHRLPLGHGGLIDLPTPAGKIVSVPCTLLRCREAAPGWYEGSVYFNREQDGLVPRSAG